MATDAGYAKYVLDQLAHAGGMSVLKMFGEFALYRHGKVVALICDNQLFVKPTPQGEAVLGTPTFGEAYPGSKPFFNVSDLLDDPDKLTQLILVTDAALPAPKKKAKKGEAKKSAAKPAAKKVAAKKPLAKKTAKRPAAKKSASKPAAKKAAKKSTPKRAAPKRPAAKK